MFLYLKGGEIMIRYVELNNGEKFERKNYGLNRHENLELFFYRLVNEAADRLGHIPTLEEAKDCPWMPKNLEIFDNYFPSYDFVMRKVEKLRLKQEQNRNAWRKVTPEEKAEIESLEEMKRRRTRVNDVFLKPPTWLMKKSRQENQDVEESKKQQEIARESKIKKGDDSVSRKSWKKEEIAVLMKEFFDKHSRLPEIKEIEQMDNWPCVTTIYQVFGKKEDWQRAIDDLDPEVLADKKSVAYTVEDPHGTKPETDAVARKPENKPKEKPKPLSRTPREIFFSNVEELLEMIDKTGGGKIDLLMSVQLSREDEPIELSFSINTLK